MDGFSENILGVQNLVNDETNKTDSGIESGTGVTSDSIDEYNLDMTDDELLTLSDKWVAAYAPYEGKIKLRQNRNKLFYKGNTINESIPSSSNIIFEAEETFIPQALSKNPEPVVFSDNTEEGKKESNEIKTMLQYHADTLVLSRVLSIMVRHWGIYFIGIAKHGWSKEKNDITLSVRNPKNFVFDVDGYVDVKGNFVGSHLGEKIKSTAEELIGLYPDKANEIKLKVDNKLGTGVSRIEWWTNEYSFTKFGDIVLDKHKNEFFNYSKNEKGVDENGDEVDTVVHGKNHLEAPRMPYTFLSVFSLEEAPHDVTNLIEQSISNQNRINERDIQIDRNLKTSNNSLVVSGTSFNQETAAQAARAVEDGHPIIVPDGRVNDGIVRLPASALPSGVLESQQIDKDTLRGVFGVQGMVTTSKSNTTTARGMILNQAHDSSRIGGGIGSALEQVADNIFNFQLQMYYKFYDEKHFAAIMGSDRAVDYVELMMSNLNRQFVVSVAPNSMAPRDEISEQNMALDLYKSQALDPITLFQKLNYPDPVATAKKMSLWVSNPQQYIQTYFSEQTSASQGAPNPPGEAGQIPPTTTGGTLASPQASAALSNVPINAGVAQPK